MKIMSKRIFIRFIKILALGIFMLMLASMGYFFAKKIASPKNGENAQISPGVVSHETNPVFPNLPAGVTGMYSQEENIVYDTNDYLVTCQGNLVSLYTINKEGEKIFEKVLDIEPAALKEEDRAQLEEGIILGTKAELLSLIEDYSS